jgi:uracil-DNA glycosylase family 4
VKLIQEGPKTARLILCGEAPGANEQREGRPFIGGSGMLLNDVLAGAGLSRSECFITNVCHIQPPGNDFSWFMRKQNQKHLIAGVIQLRKDILEIKPNLVVALGAQALKLLTGKPHIEKWRGSILESSVIPGQKVIGTYHPAACLRTWDYKAVVDLDMRRIAEESQYPDIRLPQREYYLNPDPATRMRLMEEMSQAEWLAIDIETVEIPGGKVVISCVGFSDRPDRAMVIPMKDSSDWLLVETLCLCAAKKIFQNGFYDVEIFHQNGIQVLHYEWDTMLAHHSLYTECATSEDEVAMLTRKGSKRKKAALMKGLAFLTSINTREPFYKDDGKRWKETGDIKVFWLYNGKDAAVTREIRDVQAQDITEFGVWSTFQHEMSLVEPLMEMTRTGILVDKEAHAQLLKKYQTEVDNLQRFLESTAGDLANAKSPQQMHALLYERLGLPVQYKKNKEGDPRVTADKDAINKLAEKYPHPVLLTILEVRERRDIIERYLNTAYGADGRMRCSFDVTGTRSGRLASRASLDGTGTNLQNQPEEIRRMYKADEGCIFVYRDYSQAEARVVAYLAREEGLIQLFEDPSRDVHKENASRIFGIPPEAVSEEQRYNAKRGVHAFNYGMEDDKFVKVVNQAYRDTGFRMNHATARKIREGYFLLYPGIKANFWREVEQELRRDRMLVNLFGRKRMFFGRFDDKMIRDAYSFKPQSTVGDLCCMALRRCYDMIQKGRPELNAKLLLNVHDSLLMQCPIEHATTVASLMEEAMRIPLSCFGRTFYIPTDCKVGFNWGNRPKKNPEDNPRGLIALDKWITEVAA